MIEYTDFLKPAGLNFLSIDFIEPLNGCKMNYTTFFKGDCMVLNRNRLKFIAKFRIKERK